MKAEDVSDIVCEVAEGTVHRLWEPLAAKQQPVNGYAAKFSTPFLIAYAFVHDGVGLDAFTDDAIGDQRVRALAAKIRYEIDPNNPYPRNYTGHLRATLRDGRVIEERQPHLRGGAHEPLTRRDIEEKFRLNVRHGGWPDDRASLALQSMRRLYDGPFTLETLRT